MYKKRKRSFVDIKIDNFNFRIVFFVSVCYFICVVYILFFVGIFV